MHSLLCVLSKSLTLSESEILISYYGEEGDNHSFRRFLLSIYQGAAEAAVVGGGETTVNTVETASSSRWTVQWKSQALVKPSANV